MIVALLAYLFSPTTLRKALLKAEWVERTIQRPKRLTGGSDDAQKAEGTIAGADVPVLLTPLVDDLSRERMVAVRQLRNDATGAEVTGGSDACNHRSRAHGSIGGDLDVRVTHAQARGDRGMEARTLEPDHERRTTPVASSVPVTAETLRVTEAPIPLSAAMLDAIRTWAADDRLWGSRSATEFNLCTFARVILKAQADALASLTREVVARRVVFDDLAARFVALEATIASLTRQQQEAPVTVPYDDDGICVTIPALEQEIVTLRQQVKALEVQCEALYGKALVEADETIASLRQQLVERDAQIVELAAERDAALAATIGQVLAIMEDDTLSPSRQRRQIAALRPQTGANGVTA